MIGWGGEDGVSHVWAEKVEVIHARVGMDGVDCDCERNVCIIHTVKPTERHKGRGSVGAVVTYSHGRMTKVLVVGVCC